MSSRSIYTWALTLTGVAAAGLVGVVFLVPSTAAMLTDRILYLTDGGSFSRLLLAMTAVLVLIGVVRVRSSAAATEVAPIRSPAPETVQDDRRVHGEEFRAEIERLERGLRQGKSEIDRVEPVRERLRETTTELLMYSRGYSHSTATEHVEAGTWAERHVANAFLSSKPRRQMRLRARVRWWLYPDEAFRSRLEATLESISEEAASIYLPGAGDR